MSQLTSAIGGGTEICYDDANVTQGGIGVTSNPSSLPSGNGHIIPLPLFSICDSDGGHRCRNTVP